MGFHCYSFNTVLGFIYLSLFYVGKSWQIILGAGMGELSCVVPWLGPTPRPPPLYTFCLPLPLPMPAPQSNLRHSSDGSDKLGERTQRRYGG